MRLDRRRLQWVLPVLVVGGALIAFWALPFYLRLPYATNMGYEKITTYAATLFPGKDTWLFVLAGVGVLLSLLRRNRVGTFLGIMTVLAGVVFRVAPQARLWNARVLPFWFLCLYLLVGVAFMEAGLLIVESLRGRDGPQGRCGVPVVTALVALIWVNYPLHNLPFGHTTASGKYSWLGISSTDSSFIPSWVYWNYSGYQNSGKAREKEYFALVAEMKKLGQDPAYGCGRAMWEYEPELDQMGTPDALMLLPYWTDGCIGSQEGLYYESSATTPYHFLNAAELSDQPSNPVRGLDYPTGPNVAEGVEHLQMLGVKYFMAETPDIEAQANADSNLQLVATVGPFPVSYTTGSTTIGAAAHLEHLRGRRLGRGRPARLPAGRDDRRIARWSSPGSRRRSRGTSTPAGRDVFEAASGPKNWARVPASTTTLPRTPLPPVQVSDIHEGTETISFNVDQTGVPVLVKTSYFPNWQVSGAKGVYRVTPNLMVVVPTANHVTLTYGYTPIDWVGFLLSLLGIAGVIVLWRLRPVVYSTPRHLARGWSGWRAAGPSTAKVRERMAPFDASTLSPVFKAYDIRGTVPDQINPALARAVGGAFARFAGPGRILVARDMRPSGVELTRAFAEGVIERRDRRRRPGPDLYRRAVLRVREPGGAGRHVHRLPQPGRLQRDKAVPVRCPPGRR